MKTVIYYFSATGNSLEMARNLAAELGNCEIVSIAKAIRNPTVETTAENIGIIFPVYAWGLPRIVTDFIEKISVNKPRYVFAVATCVAISGNTLFELKTTLKSKGIHLNAGFVVKANSSSLMKLNSLDNIIMRLDSKREKLKNSAERLHEIAMEIKKQRNHKLESSDWAANVFGSMFHSMGIKAFKTKDKEFMVKPECSKCGTCVKVCPRENIENTDSGPIFRQNCELCHTCIQWCPKFAIQHADFDPSRKQYRNATVRLSDIVVN